jgi:Ca2+-binding EF-hand superfamily protein
MAFSHSEHSRRSTTHKTKARSLYTSAGFLQALSKDVHFSFSELEDLSKRYESLIPDTQYMTVNKHGDIAKFMKIEQFADLLLLMGIRVNPLIAKRIFQAIDTNNNGALDFPEYVKFFDTILKGNQKEKFEYIFYIIDYKHYGYFDKEGLIDMLT